MKNNADQEIFRRHWEKLLIPQKLEVDHNTYSNTYGKFILEPLEKGYGITIGNSLRRVLLSSLQGCAIYAVKIDGVSHEYETIKGVHEDVLQILLNLKEIQLKTLTPEPVSLELIAVGPKVLKASDISTIGKVEIINPDHVICEIDEGTEVEMHLYARMNRGFVSVEENYNYNEDLPIGTIFLDSHHSPIERINYEVQSTRVEQKTDLDKLIFEIWTNGTLLPEEALAYAAKILKENYQVFINFDEDSIQPIEDEPVEEQVPENYNLYRSVNELELSVRSINCLQNAKIDTIGELVQKTEAEMLKTKNFGRKSLQEIKTILTSMGLSLGMKIEGYNPNENISNLNN